jgi:hypothetical protein
MDRDEAIATVGRPLFAVPPDGYLAGWGGGTGGADVTVRHVRDGVWVEVQTSVGRRDPGDVQTLTSWFILRTASLEEMEFPVEVVAHRWEQDVSVNGEPLPFVFIGDESTWIAFARYAVDRTIEVEGRGLNPRDLVLVSVDPSDIPEP